MNLSSDNFSGNFLPTSVPNLLQSYCLGIAFSLQKHCCFHCSKISKRLNMNNIIETWLIFIFFVSGGTVENGTRFFARTNYNVTLNHPFGSQITNHKFHPFYSLNSPFKLLKYET